MEEGVRLALEFIWRAEEEQQQHARLKSEKEARLFEESRLKSEEDDVWLNSEDLSRLVEEARLKAEKEKQSFLKAEKEARLVKDPRQGR